MSLSRPWKYLLLGSLYLCQGLPFGFFTQALPALLREEDVGLAAIGFSSLLALPWALKFLWAPFIDRYGTRRRWLLPLQGAAIALMFALALLGSPPMGLLLGAVFAINLLSATQDIATDALALDVLKPEERGTANGLQVAGYRVGMIIGGGALLAFSSQLGLDGIFGAMAILLALGTVPLLLTSPASLLPQPNDRAQNVRAKDHHPSPEGPQSEAANAPHFLRLSRGRRIIALLVIYKFGDALAQGMLRPYLVDAGFSLDDLGVLLGTFGFVAGLLGALAGGMASSKLPRGTALRSFALLQGLSLFGYAAIASLQGPSSALVTVAICAEHFAGGMATAALFTAMMDWSRRAQSATDYTVQASAVVLSTGIATTLSGVLAEGLGYPGLFALGALSSLMALVALSPRQLHLCSPPQEVAP